jgi:conjugal transfer ATP-binding protein TraC
VGFLLEAAPAVGLDENRLNILTGLVTQGIKNHTAIQISLWGDPDIHPLLDAWLETRQHGGGEFAAALQGLANRRVDYLRTAAWQSLFSDQPLLLRNWRVFVSFLRPRVPGNNRVDATEIDYLLRTRESFRSTLQSAGMASQEVPPEALVRLVDGIVNPTTLPRDEMRYDPDRRLRDQVSDRDALVLVGRDALSLIHENWHTTPLPFSVRQYPKAWAGWNNGELTGSLLNNVLRLPCPVLVTQTIYAGDQVEAINEAKLRSARATQMTDSPVGRYVPAWKDRQRDWDFVVQKIGEGHKLLASHYQVVAFAPRGEEEYCEQKLKAVYDARGWSLQKDRFSTLIALRSALPMGAGPNLVSELKRLGYLHKMLTWSAVNTAPFIGEWKGTGSPLLMLIGRKGQIQFFDPFDNRKGNFNMACAATSGAGKSFFSQEMISSMISTGGRIFVIDSGDSYKNLCSLYGGTYIKADFVLNPFSNVNPAEFEEDELPIIKQILAKMASPNAPVDSLHLSYLEQAIKAAWDEEQGHTEITEVAAALAAGATQEQKNLAVMLHPWTRRGSYGRYFTGPSNVDLDSHFVVLELGDLDSRPDLQGVVVMILMLKITETMYRQERSLRKLCIIDEAWRFLGNGNADDFIEAGYRTARKYGGAFMTITQGIDDYYESASSQAALNCSDWVLLLRQKPESLAAASDNKRIFVDDSARDLLLSVDTMQGKYSEVAIRGPNGLSIGRLIVDRFTEKLYSTVGAEFQYVQDAVASGKTIDEAVEELVRRSGAR